MTHAPRECPEGRHAFGPWTSEVITNVAGEQQYVLQRRCYSCPAIQEEPAAVVEENPPTTFKEVLRELDTYNADD